jgi:hypothetical protein
LHRGLVSFVTSIRYAESTDIGGFDRCLGTGELTIEINLEDDEYRFLNERDH